MEHCFRIVTTNSIHTPESKNIRLDVALVDLGFAESRTQAQSLIAAGLVMVNERRAERGTEKVVPGVDDIHILRATRTWVSRGALKLISALDHFGINVQNTVALDSGSSTGGFTEVLLDRGASHVYAVDVGYGILDARLRNDARITVLERTNLRYLTSLPGPQPTLVTLDLSFISIRTVLPAMLHLAPMATVVALFKPQFELPREAVGHRGVITDREATAAALQNFQEWCSTVLCATVLGEPFPSAVTGRDGNQEWFIVIRLPAAGGKEAGDNEHA